MRKLKYVKLFENFLIKEEAQIQVVQLVHQVPLAIVRSYLKHSEYDLANSLGNCAFFAKDFYDWAKANGMSPDLIYLEHENQKADVVEDHIIPVLDGYAVDFSYTPEGVSRKTRMDNPDAFKYQLEPEYTPEEGVKEKYSKFGYPDYFFVSYEDAFGGSNPKVLTIEKPKKK